MGSDLIGFTDSRCAGGQPAQPMAQASQHARGLQPAAGEQGILQNLLAGLGQHPQKGPVEVDQVGIIGSQEAHGATALGRILPPHVKDRLPQCHGAGFLLAKYLV